MTGRPPLDEETKAVYAAEDAAAQAWSPRRYRTFAELTAEVERIVTSDWWAETFAGAPIEVYLERRSGTATFSAACRRDGTGAVVRRRPSLERRRGLSRAGPPGHRLGPRCRLPGGAGETLAHGVRFLRHQRTPVPVGTPRPIWVVNQPSTNLDLWPRHHPPELEHTIHFDADD